MMRCLLSRRWPPLTSRKKLLNNLKNLKQSAELSLYLALLGLLLASGGCVYRINIQQGNLLEEEITSQVKAGMTRSQIRFLLGTPMVEDSFHSDRWDYVYYFKQGKRKKAFRQRLVVFFDGDTVREVVREDSGEIDVKESGRGILRGI